MASGKINNCHYQIFFYFWENQQERQKKIRGCGWGSQISPAAIKAIFRVRQNAKPENGATLTFKVLKVWLPVKQPIINNYNIKITITIYTGVGVLKPTSLDLDNDRKNNFTHDVEIYLSVLTGSYNSPVSYTP